MGHKTFRNEIIWRRTHAHNKISKQYGPIHDTLLFYSKSDDFYFYPGTRPAMRGYIREWFTGEDEHGPFRTNMLTGPGTRTGSSGQPWGGFDPTSVGRHWSIPKSLRVFMPSGSGDWSTQRTLDYLDENGHLYIPRDGEGQPKYKQHVSPGIPYQDIWAYQPYTQESLFDSDECIDEDVKWLGHEKERLGYPTQKPEGLLVRIIETSCPEHGLVLDPFCGCGTTVSVAEKLRSRWIGIDVTHLAITLMERRLKDAFGEQLAPYQVIGDPKDIGGARALAETNRHQFEWWALSLVEAKPAQDKKKGADSGIDGYINFFDDESGQAKKVVVQVKSGHVSVHQVRDLCHVVEREKATIGVFVTLEKPTGPMKTEAAGFGFYTPEHYPDRKYPRMQLLTVEDLLVHKLEVQYPKTLAPPATFKKAPTKKKTPKPSDKSHPDAMFEDGLLTGDEE
jgi:hypothetical protein